MKCIFVMAKNTLFFIICHKAFPIIIINIVLETVIHYFQDSLMNRTFCKNSIYLKYNICSNVKMYGHILLIQ